MATDPTVNLRGDATSLVNAIDQATTAFINFSRETARVAKDQTTLNAQGDVLVRTITQLDEAGNKVITTWRKMEDGVKQTSVVIRAQSDNLKVLASQAALAAEATALIARSNELAAATGVKHDAQLVATAAALRAEAAVAFEAAAAQEALAVAQKNSGAAAAARVKGTQLNTQAEALATRAIEASNAARASAVPIINTEIAALRARAAAIRSSIAGVAARAPTVKKAKAQRFKDEDRVQGEFQKRIADEEKVSAKAFEEEKKIAALRILDAEIIALERIEAEEKVALAAFNIQKKIAADRIAEAKAIEAERIAAEERVAVAAFNVQKKIAADRIAEAKAIEAERIAAEERVAVAAFNVQKKIAADRIAEAKAIEKERIAAEEKVAVAAFNIQKKISADRIAEAKAIEQERIASEEKVAVAAFNIQKKIAADRIAEAKAIEQERIASEEKVAVAAFKAQKKIAADRIAEAKAIEKERIEGEEKVAAAAIAADKKLRASRIKDAKAIEAERIAGAQKEFADRVKFGEQLKAKLFKDIQLEKAARLEAINVERAARLSTRTPIVAQRLQTGTAGQSEINTFLQAETAAKKFAATSVTAFKQVDAAIAQARAGTLKFTGNLTQAEQAALKLVAAEKQVAAGANQANAASKGLGASIKSLGSLIGISLLIGGAFRLVQAFTDAAKAAGELTIKISEIETISTGAARSTEAWAADLRKLSDAFGIDTLSQAEGAYQILSRQIKNAAGASIQGAEALKFLEIANKLAVTGVTDTATATNLLTSALNSFKIPAEQAEIVAAKLFKSVELGALRIEDIADILGRVAVPAKALGLNLDEVLGSIDGLTRQGFKANEAITGMRNVILKLLKPTKAGSEALRALGADTGQALIEARGFIPGLQAFIKELGDTVEGTAEGFGRIRAIVGALGLTGENAEAAADSIRQIKDATIESFGADTQRVLASTGKQFEIMREQAQNLFEKELGGPALVAIAKFIKESGGINKILAETIKVMKILGKGLFAFAKASVFVAENIRAVGLALAITFAAKRLLAINALFAGLTLLESASFAAALAQERLAASTLAANAALLASPIGLAVVATAAIVGISILAKKASEERLKVVENTNSAILKSNNDLQTRIESANKQNTEGFKKELDKRFKAVLLISQNFIGNLNKRQDELEKQAKATAIATGEILKVFARDVSSLLSKTTKELKTFEKNAEKASAAVQKIIQGEDKAQFDIDVGIAGFGTAIKLVKVEIEKARAAVAKATEAGDLKQFEIQRKRLNDFVKQRIESEVKFAKAQSKIDSELADARLARQEARTREERQAADERISGLNRQQKILREGNGAQLQQEQALAKIRDKARLAQDAAAFKDAIDSLAKLKREQERLNTLAATERRIRAETVVETLKQAAQAAEIARINKERAKQARIEQQAIKTLQFQFSLVRKTAEAFNIERITEGETAEEINAAVVEQQKNFAKLITLGRQLTGGTQLDASFIEQETQLREQAQNQIEILEEKAQAKRLEKIKEELQERLAISQKATKADLIRLDIIQKRSSQLFALQTDTLAGQTDQAAGNKIRIALGEEAVPGRGKLAQSEDANTRFDILIGEAKTLNDLIIEQTKSFSGERQTQIERLVSEITQQVGGIQNLEDVGASRRSRGATTGAERDIQDINATILAFVASIQNTSKFTKQLSERQDEAGRIVKAIADFSSPQEQAIKTEIEKRDENSTELERSTRLITEFNDLISGKKRVLPGPSEAPPASVLLESQAVSGAETAKATAVATAETAAKATAEGMEKGASAAQDMVEKSTKESVEAGAKKGFETAAETLKKAQEAAKVAREAEEKATKERDTNLKKQIAELEAGIKKRQAAALAPAAPLTRAKEPEFKGKEVDTTIFLGQGALPIAEQQAKIQVALAKAAEENAKAQKAQENRRKTDAAILRASGKGRTGANAGGLFTRGRTGGPRAGTFKGGLRPGQSTKQGGEGPTQQKQLTAGEQTAANTKALVDAQKAKDEDVSQSTLDAEATPLGLGVAAPTQPGTPASRIGSVLPGLLGQGQDEAAAELARITGRNADAQNRILRAQEAATLIWEENNSAQNQFVNSIRTGVDETDKMFLLNRQRVPLAKAALDAEQEAFDNFTAAEDAAAKQAEPLKQFGEASRSLIPRSQVSPVRVDPSGGLRAPGADGSSVTNVGGIVVTVNESKTPEITATKLADTLNRGFRSGAIKLSHNKSGPLTFASRKARGER